MNQDLSEQWAHHETVQAQNDDLFQQYQKRHTLKMIWEEQGLRGSEVAVKAGISVSTLYKMNRKDPTVSVLSRIAVCRVLGISMDFYLALSKDEA